jgi:hypothetical protein
MEARATTTGGAGLLVACAVAIIIGFVVSTSTLYVNTPDMGWHYGLVAYIGEHARLPKEGDHYLGPMRGYAPVAHAVAAGIGAATGSELGAMTLMAVASILVVYALFIAASGRSWGETFAAGLLLLVAVFAWRRTSMLFGYELHHGFFAHLVGDALFVVALFALANARAAPRTVTFAAGMAVTLLLTWTYPLSAVKFVPAFAALLWLQREDLIERRWLLPVAAAFLGAAIILVQPPFHDMVRNAAHDGGIAFSMQRLVRGLIVLTLVCGALLFWRALAPPVLLAGAVGVVVAAWAQLFAWSVLGMGSPYAVTKHGFLVGTMLVVLLVAALTQAAVPFLRRLVPSGRDRHRTSVPWVACSAISIAFAALICFMVVRGIGLPLGPIEAYDRDVRRAVRELPVADLMGHTVSFHGQLAPNLWTLMVSNSTIAMAHLRLGWTPVGLEQFGLFNVDGPAEPKVARYAFIAAEVGRSLPLQCVVSVYASTMLVRLREGCEVIPVRSAGTLRAVVHDGAHHGLNRDSQNVNSQSPQAAKEEAMGPWGPIANPRE